MERVVRNAAKALIINAVLLRRAFGLPDFIFPYKQYEADIIIGVIEGFITCETLGFEDYPCEMTMVRWRLLPPRLFLLKAVSNLE